MSHPTRHPSAFRDRCNLTALLIGFLLTGCASPHVTITRLASTTTAPATSANTVKVLRAGELGPAHYEVLGVLNAFGIGRIGASKAALGMLKSEAAKLGADTLLGYYKDQVVAMEPVSWSSALAVRTLTAGEPTHGRKVDYLVAIPHALLDKDIATGRRSEKLDAAARQFAQMLLARRGYYARPIDAQTAELFENSLKAMDEATLSKYGGDDADSVLGIQFVAKENVSAVVFNSHTSKLEVSLFSKARKRAVWQSTGQGTMVAWMVSIFEPDTKRIVALQEGLKRAFESLPAISSNP